MFPEERIKEQWTREQDSLMQRLSKLQLDDPDGQAVVIRVRDTCEKVTVIFSEFTASYDEPSSATKEPVAQRQLLRQRLSVELSSMVSDATYVSDRIGDKVASSVRTFSLLTLVSTGAILAIIGAESILLLNAISKPIARLHSGVEIVGAGNLDYKVGTDRKDEIGQLSRAFDQMTQDLKETQIDRLRATFLSAVTHELRTPLGPLKVHLDYAVAGKLGPVPEKLQSSLQAMKRSVDRLHGLTNELLDLRRIQAGRLRVNLESMNFREILEESVKEIQAQTDQKKQRVHLEVTEGPLPAHGDPTRLRQVLMNLVNNASKFTPEEGAITIKVDDDGDTIKCKISDTGIGIRKEDLPKVFEPFSNINKPGNIQTVGLGLSITKGIVEAHGGKITVESDGEGKGATFTFTIPKLKGE
jgi:signal transduction histidine kinase